MAAATTPRNTKIDAEIREDRGSRKAQILRATGKIPAILYGHGQPPVAISLPTALATSILHSGAHTMDVTLDGKAEKVLIKGVQYDHLQSFVEHIDLMRIDPNQVVRVEIPLEFRGTPKGTKEGGILEKQTTEIELEVKALEIPDHIRVNVENMEMHQILHAKDIVLPAGAKLISSPEQIICQVRTVKEAVALAETEVAATEPEVIGKKKEEEGAEGADAAAAGAKGAAPAKK